MYNKLIIFFATGGGVGLIPGAPGTYGTFVAVLLYLAVSKISLLYYLFFILIFSLFSIGIASQAEKIFKQKDSGKIVIDEIAGYLVSMTFVPFQWKNTLAGFILFRFFDILKPFPIRWLDRNLKGGLGVVVDDLMAGVYTCILLHIIIYFVPL